MKLSARFVVPPLLLVLFLARIASTYTVFSETSDEHNHIYWGMDWFERGEYLGGDGFQPPLARAAVAVLPYLWGFRAENSWIVHEWENQTLDDFWTSLTLARIGNLFFAIAVFLGVYWWSRRLLGERSAWAACGLLVCSPTVVGHAGLATVDLAGAAAVCWALFTLWYWRLRPSWKRSLLVGAASGVAQVCKFSAAGFLALPLAAILASWWRESADRRRWRQLAFHSLCLTTVGGLVVWAAYGFDTGEIHSYRHDRAVDNGSPLSIGELLQGIRAPAPVFWAGFVDMAYLQADGHPAFLFGEKSQHGWWYYFPVALVLKSTLSLVILAFLGGWLLWRQRRIFLTDDAFWLPAIGVAGILLPSIASTMNLGVRFVLPACPLLVVLGSAVFSTKLTSPARSWALYALPMVLLGWHAIESALAHPDYIAYFTPPARSQDYLLLADSNLDWGQDKARLAAYLKESQIEDMLVMVSGSVLNKVSLPKGSQSSEWVVIGAQGLAEMRGWEARICQGFWKTSPTAGSVGRYCSFGFPPRVFGNLARVFHRQEVEERHRPAITSLRLLTPAHRAVKYASVV